MTLKMKKIALLSAYDRRGIVDFARLLVECDYEIVSTGGTGAELRSNGIDVTEVSELTGSPEILGGRVKTLHPHIHGGLLALRDDHDHLHADGTIGYTRDRLGRQQSLPIRGNSPRARRDAGRRIGEH